jgi:hypothetical protein
VRMCGCVGVRVGGGGWHVSLILAHIFSSSWLVVVHFFAGPPRSRTVVVGVARVRSRVWHRIASAWHNVDPPSLSRSLSLALSLSLSLSLCLLLLLGPSCCWCVYCCAIGSAVLVWGVVGCGCADNRALDRLPLRLLSPLFTHGTATHHLPRTTADV